MINEINKYIKGLPDKIKDSLEWYTGGNFDKINEKLRRNIKLDPTQLKNFNNIQLAFKGVPKLNKSITVYKGKNTDRVYSDKSFISTSTTINDAMKFTGKNCCILIINVSIGSKILPISMLSKYKDENEVLLDRNATLIITDTFYKNNMKFINCTYTSGMIVTDKKDVKIAEKIIKKEDNDTVIINRIFNILKDDDPDFLDEEEIVNIYKQTYPLRKVDKNIIKVVSKMLKL